MRRTLQITIAALAFATASGCAAPAAERSQSILASSLPAAGATVEASLDSLKLHFDPRARLDEVTVSGPDGTMPMMVHAVGEVADYDLPLSGLRPGSYTVEWKATARGSEHEGSFAFTVR